MKSERQTPNDITYMSDLKYGTNELSYETDMKKRSMAAKCRRREGLGIWG